jgi:hypothetical protein
MADAACGCTQIGAAARGMSNASTLTAMMAIVYPESQIHSATAARPRRLMGER